MAENRVRIVLNVDAKDASAVLKKVHGNVESVGRAVEDTGKKSSAAVSHMSSLKKAVGQLAAAMAAVAAVDMAIDFGKSTYQAFAEFETALVDMAKVTDRDLGLIKDEILSLPPVLGDSTELMRGYYQVMSAGVTEPAEAMDLLVTAAKGANAAGVEQAEMIKALTKVMAGFQGEIKNAAEASDLLFAIEQAGQTSVQELVPVIGDLATVAHIAGASTTDLGAAIAQLTQASGSTSEAATKVKAMFFELKNPTKELENAFIRLGSGYASITDMIKEEGLARTLQKIEVSANVTGKTLDSLFSSQEAKLGVSVLAANGFQGMADKLDIVGNSAGKTEEAFQRWEKTSAAVMQTFNNTIGKVLIEIGEKLAPQVNAALAELGKWIDEHKDEIVAFAEKLINSFDAEKIVIFATTAVEKIAEVITTVSGAIEKFVNSPTVKWMWDLLTGEKEKEELNIDWFITGTGSPTLPITEKLDEVDKKAREVGKGVNIDYDITANGKPISSVLTDSELNDLRNRLTQANKVIEEAETDYIDVYSTGWLTQFQVEKKQIKEINKAIKEDELTFQIKMKELQKKYGESQALAIVEANKMNEDFWLTQAKDMEDMTGRVNEAEQAIRDMDASFEDAGLTAKDFYSIVKNIANLRFDNLQNSIASIATLLEMGTSDTGEFSFSNIIGAITGKSVSLDFGLSDITDLFSGASSLFGGSAVTTSTLSTLGIGNPAAYGGVSAVSGSSFLSEIGAGIGEALGMSTSTMSSIGSVVSGITSALSVIGPILGIGTLLFSLIGNNDLPELKGGALPEKINMSWGDPISEAATHMYADDGATSQQLDAFLASMDQGKEAIRDRYAAMAEAASGAFGAALSNAMDNAVIVTDLNFNRISLANEEDYKEGLDRSLHLVQFEMQKSIEGQMADFARKSIDSVRGAFGGAFDSGLNLFSSGLNALVIGTSKIGLIDGDMKEQFEAYSEMFDSMLETTAVLNDLANIDKTLNIDFADKDEFRGAVENLDVWGVLNDSLKESISDNLFKELNLSDLSFDITAFDTIDWEAFFATPRAEIEAAFPDLAALATNEDLDKLKDAFYEVSEYFSGIGESTSHLIAAMTVYDQFTAFTEGAVTIGADLIEAANSANEAFHAYVTAMTDAGIDTSKIEGLEDMRADAMSRVIGEKISGIDLDYLNSAFNDGLDAHGIATNLSDTIIENFKQAAFTMGLQNIINEMMSPINVTIGQLFTDSGIMAAITSGDPEMMKTAMETFSSGVDALTPEFNAVSEAVKIVSDALGLSSDSVDDFTNAVNDATHALTNEQKLSNAAVALEYNPTLDPYSRASHDLESYAYDQIKGLNLGMYDTLKTDYADLYDVLAKHNFQLTALTDDQQFLVNKVLESTDSIEKKIMDYASDGTHTADDIGKYVDTLAEVIRDALRIFEITGDVAKQNFAQGMLDRIAQYGKTAIDLYATDGSLNEIKNDMSNAVRSGLEKAFEDPFQENAYDALKKSLYQAIYNSAVQGIIDAIMLQGPLAASMTGVTEAVTAYFNGTGDLSGIDNAITTLGDDMNALEGPFSVVIESLQKLFKGLGLVDDAAADAEGSAESLAKQFEALLSRMTDAVETTMQSVYLKIATEIEGRTLSEFYYYDKYTNFAKPHRDEQGRYIDPYYGYDFTVDELSNLFDWLNLSFSSFVDELAASAQAYKEAGEKQKELINTITEKITELQIGDYNTALPYDKYLAAQTEYDRLKGEIFDASGNPVSSASQSDIESFISFMDSYLEAAQNEYKSSEAYQAIYNTVISDLEKAKTYAESDTFQQVLMDEITCANDSLVEIAEKMGLQAELAAAQAEYLQEIAWLQAQTPVDESATAQAATLTQAETATAVKEGVSGYMATAPYVGAEGDYIRVRYIGDYETEMYKAIIAVMDTSNTLKSGGFFYNQLDSGLYDIWSYEREIYDRLGSMQSGGSDMSYTESVLDDIYNRLAAINSIKAYSNYISNNTNELCGIMSDIAGGLDVPGYKDGGVTYYEQLVRVSEGDIGEAHVPLSGGRSIPVDIRGGYIARDVPAGDNGNPKVARLLERLIELGEEQVDVILGKDNRPVINIGLSVDDISDAVIARIEARADRKTTRIQVRS